MSAKGFDLAIVGGGLAGASLAVALRASRLSIALVESQPPQRSIGWDARVYAISPANADFLRELGVWQHLDAARMCPVHDMAVFGDAGGRLNFSAYDSGLGELAWILEAGLMQIELWETVKRQHNVTLLCPATPQSLAVDEGGITLGLDGGRSLRARLIVGADGAKSWVRQQAGIGARITPYRETGVVANFRCRKPHRNTAFQWFRQDGILAWLPLPDNHISMVWSASDTLAQDLLALDAAALSERVAAAGGGVLGELELVTAAQGFPLRLMRVERTVAARVALIGDAAHAIHPLSGHGINLGFQDARALAGVLGALPEWRDPGELGVLRRYARERAEEPLIMQYTTHALNRLFNHRNPVVSTMRNLGLNFTNALPVVRNALIRYAAQGHF
ncbi:ubiquinone biosynthesis protein UbiH [Zoogloeaceae bacteirum Par-f-2]|jgi:ubiquinone biosynthesis UbiH/UbiF/VisC/COQ6 family hydroxylase|uniref:UbiH/UbiF family hydroxylase n=1 Tax=Pseudothauera hydrothermalis TaxID=2184083 RepID=UPI000C7C613C|nr:UbiH/UbiF family hydroxylase [Pseudothauera hydrothermalis]AUL99200.1 ubiquinone biosynthesis protein UbiH [Rhodocyclaceae bacterium]AVZ78421.1 ubiquinone biosynthesis protein UbiH [Zoogloeaceae bacteirum Par-f-2]